MGAQRVQQEYVLAGHVLQFSQKHGEDAPIGHGSGDVAENDHYPIVGTHHAAQGRASNGLAQGLPDGSLFVEQTRHLTGQHDGGILGNLHREPLSAVSKPDPHDPRLPTISLCTSYSQETRLASALSTGPGAHKLKGPHKYDRMILDEERTET